MRGFVILSLLELRDFHTIVLPFDCKPQSWALVLSGMNSVEGSLPLLFYKMLNNFPKISCDHVKLSFSSPTTYSPLLNTYGHMYTCNNVLKFMAHDCVSFSAFHVTFMFFHNSCEATHRTLAITIESGERLGPWCGAVPLFHPGARETWIKYSMHFIFSVAFQGLQIVL